MKEAYRLYGGGFDYIQLVNLNPGELPEVLEIEGKEMLRKEEFHISLVWIGRLSKIVQSHDKEKVRAEMLEEFDRFTEENSLEDYELTKELRLVKQGEQKTVIAMARMASLDVFFEKLSHKYEAELPLQPAHITLYTLPPDRVGIGIFSYEELDKLSKPIDIPQLQNLLN